MNKITNINIMDDYITFYVYSKLSMVNTNDFTIYIDDSCNYLNIMNSDPDLHDYVLDYTNSVIKSREIIEPGDVEEVTVFHLYEISVKSDIIKGMDHNLKYVKMFHVSERFANDYSDGIYYSDEILYTAEVRNINSYCSTCLDDKLMQLIMLVTFKRQLLDSAINNGDNLGAMRVYTELMDLLNVSISKDSIKMNCTTLSAYSNCSTCNTGYTTQCNGNSCSLKRC